MLYLFILMKSENRLNYFGESLVLCGVENRKYSLSRGVRTFRIEFSYS